MNDVVADMLACRSIAVVGATNRPEKFGYKIFRDLRAKGYEVIPVHPALAEIDGVACYKTVEDIPTPPEVVCCVVPPAVTEKVVRSCAARGVRFVWMQPGAESPEAIAYCRSQGLACVHGQCIMVLSHPRAMDGSRDG